MGSVQPEFVSVMYSSAFSVFPDLSEHSMDRFTNFNVIGFTVHYLSRDPSPLVKLDYRHDIWYLDPERA